MESQVIEQELQKSALTLKEQATSLQVVSLPTYQAAGELGKSLKDLEKKIIEYHKPIKQGIDTLKKQALDREKLDLTPVQESIQILRDNMNTWQREEERKRQEEERKARLVGEKSARKEREKLEAAALKALEKGKEEKAEELLERAEDVYVAPVTVAPTVAKTVATSAGNITQAKEINVTVTDMVAFVSELAKSNPGAIQSILDVKVSGLKAFVKSNGLERYAGLNITKTTGVRF